MKATTVAEGLLDKICPPRLEDAGLEDCALPPDSIKEAFLKAATAVRSHAASIFSSSDDESDANCVTDPWPNVGESSDILVEITPGADPQGACGAEKGGSVTEVPDDDVAAGEINGEEKADKAVGPAVPEGGEACVDGLQGLKIGEKGKKKLKNDEDEEGNERGGERAILGEAYV